MLTLCKLSDWGMHHLYHLSPERHREGPDFSLLHASLTQWNLLTRGDSRTSFTCLGFCQRSPSKQSMSIPASHYLRWSSRLRVLYIGCQWNGLRKWLHNSRSFGLSASPSFDGRTPQIFARLLDSSLYDADRTSALCPMNLSFSSVSHLVTERTMKGSVSSWLCRVSALRWAIHNCKIISSHVTPYYRASSLFIAVPHLLDDTSQLFC